PAEDEKYFRIAAQLGGDPRYGVARVGIAAVGWNMTDVRGGHRFKDLGMHTGPIVARERASRLLLVRHAPTITAGSGEREEGSANSTMNCGKRGSGKTEAQTVPWTFKHRRLVVPCAARASRFPLSS